MIAILQPHVPHYREEFFLGIQKRFASKIYCYEADNHSLVNNFKNASIKTERIGSRSFGPFFWYNPIPFLDNDVKKMVLMLDFKHITTWLLLLTRFIHRKKIILWGQGISIKGFLKYEKKPFVMVKWMASLADGVWFYTENEHLLFKKELPKLTAVSLNNTVSGLNEILDVIKPNKDQKDTLKKIYNISQPFVLIYCARFNEVRRIDLLLEVIQKVDNNRFGFIIIGDGSSKPSFAEYSHVYDFGKVYDFNTKKDLFNISDIYFQPAWLGLSIVEAMAYGKPIFSFERSKYVYQCVEYTFVQRGHNGNLFKDPNHMLAYLESLQIEEIENMGKNAVDYVKTNLRMEQMVNNALSIL